jgi:15-cis-phytoene desaturase
MRSVLVLGGGISGLSTALELAGECEVTVVERRSIVGGKSRTWIDPRYELFREHSFRVFHRSYANLFDAMRRIPFGNGRDVHGNLESFMDERTLFKSYPETWKEFRARGKELDFQERLRIAGDLLAVFRLMTASTGRLRRDYSNRDFEEVFALRSDGSRGLVFDVLRGMSQVEYSADRLNPDTRIMVHFIEKHFLHGPPGTGWFALKGPTSDAFLEPFRAHLERLGVRFRLDTEVTAIHHDDARGLIDSVSLRHVPSGRTEDVRADIYVSALTSDVLVPLLEDSVFESAPTLMPLRDVRRVGNNGVLLYTSEEQRLLGGYYLWHPWRPAVTAYARRWDPSIRRLDAMGLGEARGRIRDVLSYCICDWEEPGAFVKKPAKRCSPAEIYEELCRTAESDATVITNFDRTKHVPAVDAAGKSVPCLVDEALVYDPTGSFIVHNEDTLLHLPAGGYDLMPHATTGIANFVLASTHAWNAFGCGDSMESANETGRRAANAALTAIGSKRRVPVFEGRSDAAVPRLLAALRRGDEALYTMGL